VTHPAGSRTLSLLTMEAAATVRSLVLFRQSLSEKTRQVHNDIDWICGRLGTVRWWWCCAQQVGSQTNRFKQSLVARMESRSTPHWIKRSSDWSSIRIFWDLSWAHYLTIRNRKNETRSIYIRATLNHISFYREIEEAIQEFSRAYSYTI
jgi:hypothetical protein